MKENIFIFLLIILSIASGYYIDKVSYPFLLAVIWVLITATAGTLIARKIMR